MFWTNSECASVHVCMCVSNQPGPAAGRNLPTEEILKTEQDNLWYSVLLRPCCAKTHTAGRPGSQSHDVYRGGWHGGRWSHTNGLSVSPSARITQQRRSLRADQLPASAIWHHDIHSAWYRGMACSLLRFTDIRHLQGAVRFSSGLKTTRLGLDDDVTWH